MNSSMPKLLQKFINSELHDAEVYRILARGAPNEQARKLLQNMSKDEQSHAENFLAIYRSMTGYQLEPSPAPVKDSGSFRSVLKDRFLDEINDSEKYRREYLNAGSHYRLKKAFFEAYNDEMSHAVQILYLLI